MDLRTIKYILLYSEQVTLFCSIIMALIFYKSLPKPVKIFTFYLILALTIEISANILSINDINNLPLLHVLTVGELIIMSLYFRELLKSNQLFMKYFNYFFVIIGLIVLANSIFIQDIFSYNSNGKTIVQIFIIASSIFYFYHLSNNIREANTTEKSYRLINSGLLIYYSGSLFIFYFGSFFVKYQGYYHRGFAVFNAALYLTFLIIVFIALLKIIRFVRRKKTPSFE